MNPIYRLATLIAAVAVTMALPATASALPRLTKADAHYFAKKNIKSIFASAWTSGTQRQIGCWDRISRVEGVFNCAGWNFSNYRFHGWTQIKYVKVDGTLYWDNKFRIVRNETATGKKCVYRLPYGVGNPVTQHCS
jgi:hypothetical protein